MIQMGVLLWMQLKMPRLKNQS
uniref:Uncharacterized protein n=1 Tax=Tetranychus urticae TaxID=32264 RepID=T1KNY6_TETUR